MKPNILFITTDHQRYDSLNMIVNDIEVTPNLNRLGEESVNFSRAYNTCPLCVPARTSLATGKYPTNNGVIYNDWKGETSTECKTIHEILRDNNYDLYHIGVNHIQVREGFKNIGFKKYIDNKDYNDYISYKNISNKREEIHQSLIKQKMYDGSYNEKYLSNTQVSIWEHDTNDYKDTFFMNKSIETLNEINGDDTFAMFVNLWAPHPPLKIPDEYYHKFPPSRIELPNNIGKSSDNEPSSRRDSVPAQLAHGIDEKQWSEVWSAHLGLVNYADSIIGNIIDTLKKKGLYDNTIIVFTSDHGDHLGQHNMYQKMEMYDQAINVPLLIKLPNFKHLDIDTPVSHLDIVPTILDELNLKHDYKFDGISLLPQIRNNILDNDRHVYCHYSGNVGIGTIRRAVVNKQYKFIYDENKEVELYDLINDPLEMKNIAYEEEYKDTVNKMYVKCIEWGVSKNDFFFKDLFIQGRR